MLEKEQEEVEILFKPAPIHFTFHLHLTAVSIKMHYDKILSAAIKHHQLPHYYNYITVIYYLVGESWDEMRKLTARTAFLLSV